jgi:hypothetical protein
MQCPASHIIPNLLRITRRYGAALTLFVFLFSCSRRTVITTWKASTISFSNPYAFDKILVTGMVQDTTLAMRRQMERYFADGLKQLGYNAVAYTDEFGPRGLLRLHQEQMYQKLSGNGIDVVLTIALIDTKKEKQDMPARMKYYSNLYYYNRIWNYQKIQAAPLSRTDASEKSGPVVWECVLFDLVTLQPLYAIQSRSVPGAFTEKEAQHYAAEMITLLVKKKVLAQQPAITAKPANGF